MSHAYPVRPGIPAAGHIAAGSGAWHPGAIDGCHQCPAPLLPAGIRTEPIRDSHRGPGARSGVKVWQGRRLLGTVDRYDYRTGRMTSRWRWVLEGGRTTLPRFIRRADAVRALLRECGIVR
jgi:hypothetical protein